MFKKYFLILSIPFYSIIFTQESHLQELYQEFWIDYENKNYAKGKEKLTRIVNDEKFINTHLLKIWIEDLNFIHYVYYNLACCNFLLSNFEEGYDYLEKSFKYT